MSKEKSGKKTVPKRSRFARKTKSKSTYTSLMYKSKVKKDQKARKKAEDLASLPKTPGKRFLAHFQPKRVFHYWFSWNGLKKIGKFIAACILLSIIAVGALFLYYKKDLEAIRLDELKVSETVNTYLDRNGEVLWEDRGDGDYRLVVDGSDISTYMRQATVAIEDRNFYNHNGVDLFSLVRAAFSTLSGKSVQGGSTLTQQLIKQVYFSDESADRGLTGIPRKIKEAILALEVEKMYDKEQIITMYLNESPYGGRRNGVESAAQTYFGKSAKDLTLAESALLAAIPQNPAVFNPYNEYGHDQLIWRQQYTLDVMAELGFITEQQRDEAKAVPILDQIQPEQEQYSNMKAPHFVLTVKSYLENKYGVKTMRSGGFTIKTTLDYRAQQMAEQAVAEGAELFYTNASDNISLSSVDVETSQVIAMVGSADWNAPVYGQVNAATSPLEPGSSIKPILDYTPLFMQRSDINYGPGSVLRDENIDSLYCAGYSGACALRNASGAFYGNLTIRKSLGNSLNIPAVKALYINGIDNSLEIAHALGDEYYCSDNENAGLSMAIGSGCTVIPIEHANAYASLARGGVAKPLAYVLEVRNSAGDLIEQWEDTAGDRVVDEQVAYMISSILSDPDARTITFGSQARDYGFYMQGIWSASKTGTTTTAVSTQAKDSWMISYTPAVSTVVWNGNHDGSALGAATNYVVRRVIDSYMRPVHFDLYANDGRWSQNQAPDRPAGIQTLNIGGNTDIWPSWYGSSSSGVSTQKLTFNKLNKKLAADCTPNNLKVQVEATVTIDPMTKQEIWYVPDDYDREKKDDCTDGYTGPKVTLELIKKTNSDDKKDDKDDKKKEETGVVGATVRATVTKGSGNLKSYQLIVDGKVVKSGNISGTTFDPGYTTTGKEKVIKIVITDSNDFESSAEVLVK
ncbi:MAG: transglycosylase domain-containing protein [Candidatus Saccharibacteria bacterium]|nr:transglycosylase domain-containing protein [Candidatus Saccharibacteria bacterium]